MKNKDWIKKFKEAETGHLGCSGREELKVVFDLLLEVNNKLDAKCVEDD